MIPLRAVRRVHARGHSRLASLRVDLCAAMAAAVIFLSIARIGAVSTTMQQSAVTQDVEDIKRLQQAAER
jgi:hypothetical protein